MIIFT